VGDLAEDHVRVGSTPEPSHDRLALACDDVRAAARRLEGVAHRTPVLTSAALDEMAGASVFLKAENLQRAGAFKFRGAYNRLCALRPEERAAGVVAASSGNHAQAVALAARLLGTRAAILMPEDAPASKRAATEGHGAQVLTYDRYRDDRDERTRALAAERGATVIPAYDDPLVMAGAGTTALELFDQVGDLDVLAVCAGGGGLLSGCATVAAARSRRVRVVGVQPEAAPNLARAFRTGRPAPVSVGRTIADGQQLAAPGKLTWPVISALVDDVVCVSDEEIVAAMRVLFERVKTVAEPSGASALAAVLAGRVGAPVGARVGVTLSGGNIDTARFSSLMTA